MPLTLRQLNHLRIDWMKEQALKVNLWLFDHPQSSAPTASSQHSLSLKNVRRILCLRLDDKLGDMVVSTILYREIKNAFPHIEIDVASGPASLELLKNNPYVSNTLIFKKGTWNVLKLGAQLQRRHYDLVIDVRPLIDARTIYLLAQTKAPWILGVSRQKLNLMNLHLSEFKKNHHISKKYEKILNFLNITPTHLQYDLFVTPQEIQKAKSLISEPAKIIVLNPFAGARYRSLNPEKIILIVNELLRQKGRQQLKIFLMCPPQEKDGLQSLIQQQNWKEVFVPQNFTSLREYVALISLADVIISPDTSAVHIASAFNKPLICFYRYDLDAPEINSQVWAPTSKKYKIIYARELNSEKSEIDMSSFEPKDFESALHWF